MLEYNISSKCTSRFVGCLLSLVLPCLEMRLIKEAQVQVSGDLVVLHLTKDWFWQHHSSLSLTSFNSYIKYLHTSLYQTFFVSAKTKVILCISCNFQNIKVLLPVHVLLIKPSTHNQKPLDQLLFIKQFSLCRKSRSKINHFQFDCFWKIMSIVYYKPFQYWRNILHKIKDGVY